MEEMTFGDFSKLAARRGHRAESLAERFKGKIENPSGFFNRVMQARYAEVVIPYRSVLAFHVEEMHYFTDSNPKQRRCACGCDQPVFDRQKWALPGCKKKTARRTVTDRQNGVLQVPDFVEAKPGQKEPMATLPLTAI